MKLKILIVDDDTHILTSLSAYLRDCEFEVVTAQNIAEAKRLNNDLIDIVLLDLQLPDGNGLDYLKQARADHPHQSVVMISGQASLADAMEAVKIGAADFLEKPVSPEKVEITLLNALKLSSLQKKADVDKNQKLKSYNLIGDSPAINKVKSDINAVAKTDSTVLLLGESGTGKEVAANLIHLKSNRCDKPFIAVNAAAIPTELMESEMFGHEKGAFTGAIKRRIGAFEQASGGTLFLDEIAEMPAILQTKLLRVLEEKTIQRVGGSENINIDLRLITATNRNLTDEIKTGNFRNDLFFRINVFTIELPPLRKIKSDLKIIIEYHLQALCYKMGKGEVSLSSDLVSELEKYHFPGNVRELRNLLERMLITSSSNELQASELSGLITKNISSDSDLILKEAVAKFELEYIKSTMAKYDGNITKVAESLGLDRSYLYRKLKALAE